MRKSVLLTLIATALGGLAPATAAAQAFDWPEFTDAQRWERAGLHASLGIISAMVYAKQHGSTIEDFGRWYTDQYKPGWGTPGSLGPQRLMAGMRRNIMLWPGVRFEIVSDSDASVTGRINRPWTQYWGEQKTLYDITLAEYEQVLGIFMRGIAEYHNLAYEEKRDGEHLVFRFARK